MTRANKIRKLPHRRKYYNAILRGVLASFAIILVSLAIGILGYHYFFHLGFYDSLLNASMILTGMGPVDAARTDGAKVFASIYALYSGIAFLSCVAIVFGPVIHRFLHRFHIDIEE